jgi:hypothetical protein
MRDETLVETYKHRGCTIEVHSDADPQSPREWDNAGKMVCWHRRYNLGDEQPKEDANEYLRSLAIDAMTENEEAAFRDEQEAKDNGEGLYDREDITNEQIKTLLEKHYIMLPLYLYDHSGITISTGRFSCPWDSGQVGFVYMSAEYAKKEWINITDEKALREKAEEIMRCEVRIYDDYLTGSVYGYNTTDWDGNDIGSCWGFFGYDETKEDGDMVKEAKSEIDHYIDVEYPKTGEQPGEVDQPEFELQTA